MIKSELIQLIAQQNPHLYHRDVERIINTIFDEIIVALARGDRVELRGFVKSRNARQGASANRRLGRRRCQADPVFQDRQGTARQAERGSRLILENRPAIDEE